MYTDQDYLIKDRFRSENSPKDSLSTLFRTRKELAAKASQLDPGLKGSSSLNTLLHVPPSLEPLASCVKLCLYKQIEVLKSNITGGYIAEIVDESGNRVFLIQTSTHFDSDEVIHYRKFKKMTVKGKFCYSVVNYAGVPVFQIYGDPERVVRIGPNSLVWGEIQVLPSSVWDNLPYLCTCTLTCSCCRKKKSGKLNKHEKVEDNEAEVRVVVLKKDEGPKKGPGHHAVPFFKHVFTLKGILIHRFYHEPNNSFYKKSFDLKIFETDILEEDEGEGPEGERQYEEIGRVCSSVYHEGLGCYLPTLEVPKGMDVYDKITLMGTLFLFSLKI